MRGACAIPMTSIVGQRRLRHHQIWGSKPWYTGIAFCRNQNRWCSFLCSSYQHMKMDCSISSIYGHRFSISSWRSWRLSLISAGCAVEHRFHELSLWRVLAAGCLEMICCLMVLMDLEF